MKNRSFYYVHECLRINNNKKNKNISAMEQSEIFELNFTQVHELSFFQCSFISGFIFTFILRASQIIIYKNRISGCSSKNIDVLGQYLHLHYCVLVSFSRLFIWHYLKHFGSFDKPDRLNCTLG